MYDDLHYQAGFGNTFQTEALPNTLPKGQNSPQKVPRGLYAEQLSGCAFTVPRKAQQRSWLYRIQPSVVHASFESLQHPTLLSPPFAHPTPPTQMRWRPLPYPSQATDLISSLHTVIANGSPASLTGAAVHLYAATSSMRNHYFYNADGDFLFVPQEGELLLKTEMGLLKVKPGEIAVIQRGIKFQVELLQQQARGYICENFGAHFALPDLGPIGSNGLAHEREFLTPVAWFEERQENLTLLVKHQGHLWQAAMNHSPLNVVAWHGNYAPYKYDLAQFNTHGTISFDHTDPSIFTVLTAQTSVPGVANVDFVIFPPRWMVAEHTMRLPYYHRNIMSEYMGLITGAYDAKGGAFVPGGGSLHNCMSAHGPDADSYAKAIEAELNPQCYQNTLAFMFESCYPWQVSEFALDEKMRDMKYLECWQGLGAGFVR